MLLVLPEMAYGKRAIEDIMFAMQFIIGHVPLEEERATLL